jgi:hypothetical protein
MMIRKASYEMETTRMPSTDQNNLSFRQMLPSIQHELKPILSLCSSDCGTQAAHEIPVPGMTLASVIRHMLPEAQICHSLLLPASSQRSRQRVRFQIDSNRRKVDTREEKAYGTDVACTGELSSDLYWTMEEQRLARRRAGCNGFLVRSKYPRQVEALARLYQTSSCHDGDDMSSNGTDGNASDDSASIDEQDFQVMRMWSRSKARGLEESVLPQIRQNRQRAVNAVLAHQAQIRQLDKSRHQSLLHATAQTSTFEQDYLYTRVPMSTQYGLKPKVSGICGSIGLGRCNGSL